MPYIDDEAKDRLDSAPEVEIDHAMNAGELTYKIQQLLNTYLEDRSLRYATLAECLGALEGAKIDLTDRVLLPYEKAKRIENGDVWPEQLVRHVTEPGAVSNAGPVVRQAYDPRQRRPPGPPPPGPLAPPRPPRHRPVS